jgi:glycosyltransferase involved in cell wall biosynthesis
MVARAAASVEAPVQAALRILFVSALYPPYTGGIETHTREVARRLASRGHQVSVLTTDPAARLPRFERMDGVAVSRVPAWPSWADLYFAPGVYRAIRSGTWDIVHVQGYHTLVPPLAMLAAMHAKLPYVVTFHGGGHSSRVRNSIRGTQRALLAPLWKRAARLIALAEFELTLFGDRLGIPRSHFAMIPNGSDLPIPKQVTPRPDQGPLIASVGRLERYKGHHRVLAAMPMILKREPGARLWIAGSGPFESALRRQAQKLGVSDHVEIRAIPATDRETMADELSRAAVVTLLSEYETQPVAVLEALSLGRPALVADTSGMSEIARRGLALAVPLDSAPDVVAAAVLKQLDDPILPTQLQLPTWDECVDRLSALYQSVVQCPSGA